MHMQRIVRSLSRNRVFMLSDVVLFTGAVVFGALLRFDFGAIPEWVRAAMLSYAIGAIPLKIGVLFASGVYRRLWLTASVGDMLRLGLAATGAAVAAGLYWFVLAYGSHGMVRPPLSIVGVDLVLTLLVPVLPRAALRALEHRRWLPGATASPALIIGAGAAGQMVSKELMRNPRLSLSPIGFVDDDPTKQRRVVAGLPVLGTIADIPKVAAGYGVTHALIAMPSAPGSVIRTVVELARAAELETRTIPSLLELIEGAVGGSSLRELRIEDLLRRAPVQTNFASVSSFLEDRTVLITGAGGSIGSELCRQISTLYPSRLVILGHGENSIFEIQQELRNRIPELDISAVIADVRDRARIFEVIENHHPYAIFHAAAHKHVPLMEENVIEAITNNVVGTKNIVDAALRGGVPHLVMISTDKAVRPTSVMGATKRIAEMVVQNAAVRNERRYVAVRFGNVLGSRGSVVPTFLKQIRAGGPVTVTDPEMRRYFMTIPESVQLVLQAGAMGIGAEVFLLDMGEPVKVVDLATDLIRLSGLEPGRDIQIKFTGMRPGEKLYEEMFFSNEEAHPTDHPKILRAKKSGLQATVPAQIAALIEATLEGQSSDALRARLQSIVPDFTNNGASTASQASAPPLRSSLAGLKDRA
jgi:FlaA1/EpsC-like NDP-sugar epimerase